MNVKIQNVSELFFARQNRRLPVNDSVDSGIDCKDRKDAWLTKKNHIQPREE